MEDQIRAMVIEGFRALFLLLLPLSGGVLAGGILVSLLQSALGIYDSGISYMIRMIVFAAMLYVFLPSCISSLTALAELSFQ